MRQGNSSSSTAVVNPMKPGELPPVSSSLSGWYYISSPQHTPLVSVYRRRAPITPPVPQSRPHSWRTSLDPTSTDNRGLAPNWKTPTSALLSDATTERCEWTYRDQSSFFEAVNHKPNRYVFVRGLVDRTGGLNFAYYRPRMPLPPLDVDFQDDGN
jgi:hypothetical protein